MARKEEVVESEKYARQYANRAKHGTPGSFRKGEDYEQAAIFYQQAGNFKESAVMYEEAAKAYEHVKEKQHLTEGKEEAVKIRRLLRERYSHSHTEHRHKASALETMSIVGIVVGFLCTILFLSNSITGYSTIDLPQTSSMSLGVIFLAIALTGLAIFFSNRKN